MKRARIFTPENRLARALSNLDGPTNQELLQRAELRIALMREAIRGYVKEKLTLLLPYADAPEEKLFAECRELAAHALAIAEVGGAAGLEAIGEVARGVNAMIQALSSQGIWHTEALRLHLNSLVLLNERSGTAGEPDELVLGRLRAMRRAIGVNE